MSKIAACHARTGRRNRRGPAVLVVGCLVSAGLVVTSGPVLALAGSPFESTDGNRVVNGGAGAQDWINAPNLRTAFDITPKSADNSLGQGSKDDHVNVTVGTGSIPTNKSDLTRFDVAYESVGSTSFLYLAWERDNTLGTANFSFELNQNAQPNMTNPGPVVLDRLAGDALITYDFAQGGKKPAIGLAFWVTAGNPKTACQASNEVPCWGKISKLSDVKPPIADGGISADLKFGEAAINVTQSKLLNACRGFRSATVRSRASAAFNAELKDFIAPFEVNILLQPDASGAQADSLDPDDLPGNDGAVAIRLRDGSSTPVDLPNTQDDPVTPANEAAGPTKSSQTGPGNSRDSDSLKSVSVDDPRTGDNIVRAELLSESSDSTVLAATALAQQVTQAKVLGLNVLEGVLTADVVDSVAQAYASPDLANTNSTATTFAGVAIDPDGGWNPTTDPRSVTVTPGLFVPLNETIFGADSGVTFLEEQAVTKHPPPGTKAGSTGTYDATLRVAAIHVFVRDRAPLTAGDQTTDLVVSRAFAHARFTGLICTAPQEVSGNALILSASAPAVLGPRPVTVGSVRIPSSGGHDHAGPLNARHPAAPTPAVVSVGVAETDTSGRFDSHDASAASWADVASVCVQQTGTTETGVPICTVDAQAIRAQADAIATATSRSAVGSVEILGLRIAGTPVNVSVAAPNQRFDLPGGVGYVIVNEQFCDSGSASGCAAGGSAGITVRTLHVVIPGVLDVVIGEAHADATFVQPA